MRTRLHRPGGAGGREDVGLDLPRRLRPDPPVPRRPARLPVVVHHLRRHRLPAPRRADPAGPEHRRQEDPAPVGPGHHLGGQGRAHRGRRLRRPAPAVGLRAADGRRLRRVPAAPLRRVGHGLRRPPAPDGQAVPRRTPTCSTRTRQRFRQVLVDEYQDTNRVQNELVMLLCAEHRNVCIVGDTDQSIYAFRGADIRNILEFEKAFPDAAIIPLEQNYRSTKTILDAANAVIVNNTSRVPKELWTDGDRGRARQPVPGRGRVRRGGLGGGRDRPAAPRRRPALRRRGHLLPDERPEPGPRRGARPDVPSPTRWWAAPASTTGAR